MNRIPSERVVYLAAEARAVKYVLGRICRLD